MNYKKYIKKITVLGMLSFLTVLPLVSLAQVGAGEGKNASAAITEEATNVTDTTAKLNGVVLANTEFPAGEVASVYFRYSSKVNFPPVFCNDVFGSDMHSTKELKIALNDIGGVSFQKEVSDLNPDTTYYFCAVASNKNYIQYGEVKKFPTKISSLVNMSVTTNTATVVDTKSAYLNGFYNTGTPASTWFEYRKMSNDANTLDKQSTVGKKLTDYIWSGKRGEKSHNGETNGTMSYLLSGLSPNTTYQFRTAIRGNSDINTVYGEILTFKTSGNSTVGSGSYGVDYGADNQGSGNLSNLSLGQSAVPPVDAVVHYHEGIEHVFVRQIMANATLAKRYGYQDGMNLSLFAWDTAHFFAQIFGYVANNGKEIRVSTPDIAAYRLELKDGDLTVYEYYNGVIVHIQKMTEVLRGKYGYEYYFQK